MKLALEQLKRQLAEIEDLESAARLLEWDECIYMPPLSAQAHCRQKTTLVKVAHEKFTSAAIGTLLDRLAVHAESLPYDSDEASLIRVTRRAHQRAVRLPARFVTRLEQHKSDCYDAWYQSRETNDFSIVAPFLKTSIDLSREFAEFFPGYRHVADPLIDRNDHGMKVSLLTPVFRSLRNALIPLLWAILERPEPDDSFLFRRYPKGQQIGFGRGVIGRCGFDFLRGRQDLSMHPFTINMSLDDVRITTTVNEESFFEAFSGTMHEAGHAIYLQGVPQRFAGTPLMNCASMGMDEGQARLWENVVGRSLQFWRYFYPVLQEVFPTQLKALPLTAFYRAINKVKPSLRRTEADEITYNLHVLIRFDLELQLLEGSLKVEELPEAWNERYRSDLGIVPGSLAEGVLQDVHWYCDLLGGGFQGYAIGNILSAFFYHAAVAEHPGIPQELEEGHFTTLRSWLTDNVFRHGSKLSAAEVVSRVSDDPLPVQPYLDYLRSKYADLYGLDGTSAVPFRYGKGPAHLGETFSDADPFTFPA